RVESTGRKAVNIVIAAALLASCLIGATPAAAQTSSASVAGAVSVTGPDGQPFVVPGVTLTLTCGSAAPMVEVSNERGGFRSAGRAAGACSLQGELQGFKTTSKDVAVVDGEPAAVMMQLGLDTLHEEVTVSARLDNVEANPIAANVERMTSQVMQIAPIASE